MKYCHQCRTPWEGITQPGTKDTCATCAADLHVCLNCRFYDTYKPNQCMIDTDPVLRKERANFCDDFQFADRPLPAAGKASSPAAGRSAFDKLFKK